MGVFLIDFSQLIKDLKFHFLKLFLLYHLFDP